MPYILVQITKERVSSEQKRRIVKGATDLMAEVLGKDPGLTFVVIDEVDTDNWGVGGATVSDIRSKRVGGGAT
jgi:4-oxalocrotonate tautomerase